MNVQVFLRACAWIVTVLALGACDTSKASPATATVLRFTTGIPGAGFHPLGESLVRAYVLAGDDLRLEVRESPGSVSNLEALQRGSADVGLAFADVTYLAYAGGMSDHRKPLDRLRGIAVLQLTPLHLVVSPRSSIRRIADLRGQQVGVGPPGSGTALTASLVLSAFGIGAGEVRAELLPFNAAASRLVAGTLDAMFVNGSYPAESVRFATAAGARLLPVHGADAERLRHNYPFLRPALLPRDTYPEHPETVHTIGVDTLLVCRSDLSEEVVYQLTKRFFAVLASLVPAHPTLRLIDLDQVPATPIPLHGGAARYYRERELTR
jgi:uncharacterized protein